MKTDDLVMKIDGEVRFPGCVRKAYRTMSGASRIVVECIMPGVEGLQHIYRPDQFRPMTAEEQARIRTMRMVWAGTIEISTEND